MSVTEMRCRNVVHADNHDEVLADARLVEEMRENVRAGDAYIFRSVFPAEWLISIRSYLTAVGQTSLPNYHAIEAGAPNFHRLNRLDDRAYTYGAFHQFCFFPWNQDVFNLFERFRQVYELKNLTSGLAADRFLGNTSDEGCVSRLAFQCYPKGVGRLNRHSDPVDYHQLTVPILQMTKKGVDFQTGGLFVVDEHDNQVDLDAITDVGDVVYFNAQCPHGVDPIDADEPERWLTFEGRWMLLFAINRVASNTRIGNAVDHRRRGGDDD